MPNLEALQTVYLDTELNSNSSLAGSPYSSANRVRYINEAQEEFADLTECLVRQSTITVSCNTTEYMVLSSGVLGGSTDFVRLAKQGVEYHLYSSGSTRTFLTCLSGDDFPERPIEWLNKYDQGWRQSTSPTTPTGWYRRFEGGNLYLGLTRPPKVGSSQAAQIVVPYLAKPAEMTSTAAEPFTVNSSVRTDLRIYHKALPHYAAYKLLPMIGDHDGAEKQLQKFLGYVTRFLQTIRPRGGTSVVMGRSYLRDARRRSSFDEGAPPPSQWS